MTLRRIILSATYGALFRRRAKHHLSSEDGDWRTVEIVLKNLGDK